MRSILYLSFNFFLLLLIFFLFSLVWDFTLSIEICFRLLCKQLFSTVSLPLDDSAAAHHSQIVDLEGVLASIATTSHRVSISLEVDRLTTDMRSINSMNRTSVSHIIDKDVVVPATGDYNILVTLVELDTVDAVAMTNQLALLFHFKGQRLSCFIIDSNCAISASDGQENTIVREI